MTKAMRGFMLAILVMGIVRFILDRFGVPKEVVKYFSMTVIIMIGIVHFGLVTEGHKQRLKAAYLLILPYMIIEVLKIRCSDIGSRRSHDSTKRRRTRA